MRGRERGREREGGRETESLEVLYTVFCNLVVFLFGSLVVLSSFLELCCYCLVWFVFAFVLLVITFPSDILVLQSRDMNENQNCWPSRDGLRIVHLNANHIYNKITDITTTLSNSGKPFHVFSLSESRLTINMPSCDLSIPGYSILRRDSKTNNETGLIIYINDILSYKHLSHLDQPGVEAVWLEIGFFQIYSDSGWFLLQKSRIPS